MNDSKFENEHVIREDFDKRLLQYDLKAIFMKNIENEVTMYGIDPKQYVANLNRATCWIVFITHAFFWQDTKQGVDFWRAISQIDYISKTANTGVSDGKYIP